MSTLIYDPDMTISVEDQSQLAEESDTPALDTAVSGLFVGFTSKGKHNVIIECKSPAALLNTFGDDFGSFSKYGQANLTALGFARSGGRSFFCSLLPDDAKRAYSLFGVSVKTRNDIPVYERNDTVYNEDHTEVLAFGTGAFKLDQNGEKIQCKVKAASADDEATELVVTDGVELTVETKTLEDTIGNFDSEGRPVNYDGSPIISEIEGGATSTFYPLFCVYYYGLGKGGNDYGYVIERNTGRDKKMLDGRRYSITFFNLLSSGSYANLYPEPFYFAFNPNAKFSEDSDVMEGLSSVYENTDEDGNELPIQMVTYNENYTALLNALLPYKDDTETKFDIDFINGIFKSGRPYTKIVMSDASIDTANSIIKLDGGTDGSIEVGAVVNGVTVTKESAAEVKEQLLQKFFTCDVDDNIFDEKLTDIDYLFDENYSLDIKKTIIGTFHQYRPDIKLKMDVGECASYTEAINICNELTPYVDDKYGFMISIGAHFGTLADSTVGSPFRVSYTYDFARVEADNFGTVDGKFQMHAGAKRGLVKYFRPDWIAHKDKAGMIEKLKDVNLNYIEQLNKQGAKMWGSETSCYNKTGSKLNSDRCTLIIGRAMRICHGVLPYFKYDERDIDDTLKAATKACQDALESSDIPTTVGITVKMYQTKEDKRTENAHCDIVFTFPDYAKTFTVTIIAKRPSLSDEE